MNKNKTYLSNTKPHTKCKICLSKHLDKINKLIAQHKANAKIIRRASHFRPRFEISNRNIALHRKNHVIMLDKKLLKKKKTKTTKKKTKPKTNTKKIANLNDFLDLVIANVNSEIKKGNIKPTVSDAVKAADIKSKIKGDSKYEKKLIELFVNVATEKE